MDRKRSKVSRMKSFRDLEGEVVDKRAERAHRRSVDQRQMRQMAMTRRRNISQEDGMSPIKETKKKETRKDKLKEWQQARNQRKAEEDRKQAAKKPQFKVFHAEKSILSYDRPATALAPVKGEKKAATKAEAASKEAKPASSTTTGTRRQTRSQTSTAPAPSRGAPATRAAAPATRTTRSATTVAPALNRTTRAAAGNKKETGKAPATRTTRSTAAPTAQGKKPATANKNVKATGKASAPQPEKKRKLDTAAAGKPEPAPKAAAKGRSTRQFVTRSRGSESDDAASTSFAPVDFAFTTETFRFKPLSPASAASFLFPGDPPEQDGHRRCSTPTDQIRGSSGPVMNSPQLSSIAENKRPTPLADKPTLNLAAAQADLKPSPILMAFHKTRQRKATDKDAEEEMQAVRTPGRKTPRQSTGSVAQVGKKTPRRKSMRQSQTTDTDSEVENTTKNAPVKHTPRRRSTRYAEEQDKSESEISATEKSSSIAVKRRSVQKTAEINTDSESEKPVHKTPRRRSVRQAAETTESESEVDKRVTKTPKSAQKTRRSVASEEAKTAEQESQAEVTKTETSQTKTPINRRRSRRSMTQGSETEDEQVVKPTPRGRRRSTRRSTLPELTESSAESESADGSTALFIIAEVHQGTQDVSPGSPHGHQGAPGSQDHHQGAVQDATVSTTSPTQAGGATAAADEKAVEESLSVSEIATKEGDASLGNAVASPMATAQVEDAEALKADHQLSAAQEGLEGSSTPQPAGPERDGPFLTPNSTLRLSSRRRTVHNASGILAACKGRKTPKHRNSLMLKAMSPEEKFEFMMNSPMVEMKRRKVPTLDDSLIEPLPDFDTLEAEVVSQSETSTLESDAGGSDAVVTATESDAATTATESETSASEAPVMVEPVVSTTEPATPAATEEATPDAGAEPERDVPYFRGLLVSEKRRLNEMCERWNQTKDANPQLSEEVEGQIRTTIGKAQLLMNQRFKQFEGLVDDCEFQRGEKATHCSDLQGFWDMVYFQVEDVDAKFAELVQLEAAGWQVKEQPKKKVIKKKVTKPAGPSKAAGGAKSKFAEFRAKMAAQKKKESQELSSDAPAEGKSAAPAEVPVEVKDKAQAGQGSEVIEEQPSSSEGLTADKASPAKMTMPAIHVPPQEDPEENKENINPIMKTFEAGFFCVTSPVKAPEPHCEAGSPNRILSRPGSHTNTPSASPMLKAVLNRSARKSLGLSQAVASPAGRRSLQLGGQGSSTAALVTLRLSPLAKRTPDSCRRATCDTRPPMSSGCSTGSSAEGDSVSSASSQPRTTRRSLRISELHQSNEEAVPMETNTVDAGDFSRFLEPTIVDSPKEMMELDLSLPTVNSPQDVEMAARTKRGLAAEFQEEEEQEKKESENPTVNGDKLGRRSVHFATISPPLEAQMSRLPVTPFNRDSLVPRTRRNTGDENQPADSPAVDHLLTMTPDGPGVRSSLSGDEDVGESPATQFSRLRVNYTPAPAAKSKRIQSIDDMLFSPAQTPTSPLKERNTTPNIPRQTSPLKKSMRPDDMSPTFDLISFTPANHDKPNSGNQSVAPSAGRKSALKSTTRRKSTRRSNMNVSFL